MKTIACLLLPLVLLFSCSNPAPKTDNSYTPFPIQKGPVSIKGNIDHLEKVPNLGRFLEGKNMQVVKIIDDVLGSGFSKELCRDTLDADGNFHLQFELDHPRELSFSFSRSIPLLLAPNDELFISFSADYFIGITRPEAVIKIRSKKADNVNQVRMEYIVQNRKRFDMNPQKGQRWMMDEQEYFDFWIDTENKQLAFLDSFLMDHPQASQTFVQWARQKIEMDISRILVHFPVLRKMRQKNSLPVSDQYYAQIAQRPSPSVKSSGYDALQSLMSSHRQSIVEEPLRERFTYTNYTQYDSLHVKEQLQKIQQSSNPFIRDFVLAQYLDRLLEMNQYEAVKPYYKQSIQQLVDPDFREHLEEKRKRYYESAANQFDYPEKVNVLAIKEQEDLFAFFEKKYKNKFICFTQWASWQTNWGLGSINQVLSNVNKEQLVFVYLSHHSPPGKWREEVSQSTFWGDHYLLTDAQHQSIDSLFIDDNQRRYPHLLVDQNGQIHTEHRWYTGSRLAEFIEGALKK